MATLRSLFTWRAVFLVLALVNAKSLPFAWHIRLFYHFAKNMRRLPSVKQEICLSTDTTLHPIFRPVSISSRSPFLETDYNLHKSNSTYFSDLDISRAALVTNLLSAGFRSGTKELERRGHKGPNKVILGAVHTSFHKEIKPYELYEVRSRLLGWDQKWLVILSTFIKPGRKGKPDVVLASALSKYVVKKARYTVPPERCLAAAGWFEGMDRPDPEKRTEHSEMEGKQKEEARPKNIRKIPAVALKDEPLSSESTITVNRPHEQELEAVDIAKLEAKAEEMSAKMDEKRGEGLSGGTLPAQGTDNASRALDPVTAAGRSREPGRRSSGQQWTWDMIESERRRGLELARAWMLLDGALAEESVRVQS